MAKMSQTWWKTSIYTTKKLNKLWVDSLSETREGQGRKQWDNIYKVLKGKRCQSTILYTAKLSFKNEEGITQQIKTEPVIRRLTL